MATPDPEEPVEVYHAGSKVAAHKIIYLLVRQGIDGAVHDRLEQMFPSRGEPGALYIAVRRADRERALELIAEARANGVIDDEDGEVISDR